MNNFDNDEIELYSPISENFIHCTDKYSNTDFFLNKTNELNELNEHDDDFLSTNKYNILEEKIIFTERPTSNTTLFDSLQKEKTTQIYTSKEYEKKTTEMNTTKKKRGRTYTNGEHNKFSDDNLRRKVKHIILKNLMDFINDKIYYFYKGNIGKGILIKRFLTINQKQKADATVTFNKIFLNKTLGDIYSEDISSRFTIYPPNHNKILVNQLINDKDENIKQYFINLFNLTFTDCLEHFRRTKHFKELEGLPDIGYINHKYEDDKDYIESLSYYFNNFEKITNNKRRRNRRKKKQIEESQ